jgi:FAD/FMN-containing dehydrogenase
MTATTADRLAPSHLQNLRARLRGTALTPSDDGYFAACAAWNLNAVHLPAVVVLVEDSSDIRTAVRVATQAGLGVGVLATGHGTGAPCDGGLLVNTSRMRGVQVDPDRRTVRVEAGAVWDDVVTAAARHGLAGLPGSSTKVGVVGYTLGGGFGWLGRRYGLAAHSVTSAQVATADGQLVTASPDEHPDLFWGIRGSTGNLGIVASLELALHPVRQVYAGNLYYPLDRARDVLDFFAEWSRSAPLELTAAVTFRSFLPLPTVPEPLRGTSLVALRGCFCGDPGDGEALVDRARAALGPARVDTFAVMPAAELATLSMDPVEPLAATGHSELLTDLTPDGVTALVDLAGPGSGSPLVMLEVRQLGGRLAGPGEALSPMAHTEARFSLNAIGVTPTPERAAAVRAHLEKVASRIRPYATGDSYLNFLDLDGATPERVRAAYSDRDWDRVLRLKADYDPHNVFRFNRNISSHPHTTGK